jgi:MoxR-like ATPase
MKKKKAAAPRAPKSARKPLAASPSLELVGRGEETSRVRACLRAKRNVLLEGPVGVGKTHLALAITRELDRPVFRVDGDNRYSEQKLTGWFDPPTVMKKGFSDASFLPGPLVEAMREGGVLFINELNRLPEGVQNVLLPAIDERMILVPRLGEVRAAPGFLVIATQNPKEFVATSHLSEAILDRFELVVLDYQTEEEEVAIVVDHLAGQGTPELLPIAAVRLARLTREHERVRRGASIRAAISIAEIAAVLLASGSTLEDAFLAAAIMALPTRIEIEREAETDRTGRGETEALVREWVGQVLAALGLGEQKKKTL